MKKLVSYIFPIYNEEGNIDLLFKTMQEVIQGKVGNYDFEFIFVNDGSRDNSLELLKNIQRNSHNVKVINFSRNFGHQLAVTAGLDYAKGDAVIIMDSDMQDPPKVSIELIKKWEEGWAVVYAQRKTRKDSIFKRLTAFAFYRLLERFSEVRIPKDTGDFRLLDRKVVIALNQFREKNRFLRGMVSYVGFKQTSVLFDREERFSGKTGYPLKKMIKFALDGITGFSTLPLSIILRLGTTLTIVTFIFLFGYILLALFSSEIYLSFSLLTLFTVLFIGSIQMMFLGLCSLYIGRIYTESQKRPLYIISEIYE